VKKNILNMIIAIIISTMMLFGCSSATNNEKADSQNTEGNNAVSENIKEDGRYSTVEDVSEYIHIYGKLPQNFITKSKATKLGWDSDKGNLWEATDKMSIGGDVFGNREGLLPKADGRKWFECDINYSGGYRGAERIIYSNDGLIYYTNDHYNTFKKLY